MTKQTKTNKIKLETTHPIVTVYIPCTEQARYRLKVKAAEQNKTLIQLIEDISNQL